MSLVAYGESDEDFDSGVSDGEDVTSPRARVSSSNQKQEKKDREPKTNVEVENAPQKGLASKLPPPKHGSSGAQETVSSSTAPSSKKMPFSSFLPKPKNSDVASDVPIFKKETEVLPSTSFNANDSDDEILEVEEEYVPLSKIKKKPRHTSLEESHQGKSIGSLFSRMPTPWSWQSGISIGKKTEVEREIEIVGRKNNKAKQLVRITAPSAPRPDSDEEQDEEGQPTAKKIKQSTIGSGLSALLPKPRHSVMLKANNPNKPVAKLSKRPLIPYTLTKKPAKAKKHTPKSNKKDDGGSASDDDDDEPVQFFTFNEKPHAEEVTGSKGSKDSSVATKIGLEEPSTSQYSLPLSAPKVSEFDTDSAVSSTSILPADNYMYNRSTHTCDTSVAHGISDVGSSSYESYDASSTNCTMNQDSYGSSAPTTYYYNQKGSETQQTPIDGYDQSTSYGTDPCYGYTELETQQQAQPQASTPSDELNMKELKKLQGRRNRHEEINIIDINAADQTGDVQLMATKLTSEEVAHLPSKKKGAMPTSQQRRKHQITYLAFQAKEREFELRQQWSANSQTRRQTQSKYGF